MAAQMFGREREVPRVLWSIADVVRITGVTSRTLRHYDAVGLLLPASTDDAGRRFYGQYELVRLQQILTLRALGLGLDAIATILAGECDQLRALRQHHRWLLAESTRFARLADSVSTVISDLEGGRIVTTEDRLADWFSSVAAGSATHERLEQDAEQRWGSTAAVAHERSRRRSLEQQEALHQQSVSAHARIAELAAAGSAADDDRTLDAVADHHAWLRQHWEPSPEAYRKLGEMYADPDDRFRAGYEAVQPGFAEFLRDAMAAYAAHRM